MNVNESARISFPDDLQILLTADIQASSDAVFRAFTTPELIRQWWGKPNGELTTCDIDLRPGGGWRYVFQPHDGEAARYHGTYKEVVPGSVVSYSDVLESLGNIEVQNTVTFAAHDGVTTLSILARHSSRESRDTQAETLTEAALQAGMAYLEQVAKENP